MLVEQLLLRLHYSSEPNHVEPNSAGPAVQTMLAWFGPAHFTPMDYSPWSEGKITHPNTFNVNAHVSILFTGIALCGKFLTTIIAMM